MIWFAVSGIHAFLVIKNLSAVTQSHEKWSVINTRTQISLAVLVSQCLLKQTKHTRIEFTYCFINKIFIDCVIYRSLSCGKVFVLSGGSSNSYLKLKLKGLNTLSRIITRVHGLYNDRYLVNLSKYTRFDNNCFISQMKKRRDWKKLKNQLRECF